MTRMFPAAVMIEAQSESKTLKREDDDLGKTIIYDDVINMFPLSIVMVDGIE